MTPKEMKVPLNERDPSQGNIIITYGHQILTAEDYLKIIDLKCRYILVGFGQLGKSPPILFLANRRNHEDLEHIIKTELGEKAELIANGQFTHIPGNSGYNQLETLGLFSPSVEQTSDKIVGRRLRLLLESIDPSFLTEPVYLRWRENGIERLWEYWKERKALLYQGII